MRKLFNRFLGRKTWQELQLEKAEKLKSQHKASEHIYDKLKYWRANDWSKQLDGRTLADRIAEKLEKRGVEQ